MPEKAVNSFGRTAILVLSIEWVLFGSMHFSMFAHTLDQVPPFVPLKTHAVITTGILEVATGILLLVPELRRKAAIASIVLLGLLTPAMYWILYSPAAVQRFSEGWADAFRVVLIPNNIFLAICSVYLIRHPESTLARPLEEPERVRRQRTDWSARPVTLIVPALLLAANCAGFLAISVGPPGSFGTACLWAMACIACGALIGFLFGVPRINPRVEFEGQLVHNQNIEAVSDWLTKILIGVGLVNFSAIGAFVSRLSRDLAAGIGGPDYTPFATGLIVYFFVVGIIQGYILTRMFLGNEFRLRQARARIKTLARESQQTGGTGKAS